MKSYLTLLLACFAINNGQAQIVQSSCFASDSVKALYMEDAKRLALRKIFAENLTYKDSIHIPQSHADTALNALIAVKNAQNIPEADSLTGGYYFAHTTIPYILDRIIVKADSSLAWMDSLSIGSIPTGDNYIDSLISTHYLNLTNFNSYSYYAIFESDSSYNMSALADAFMQAPMVYLAQGDSYPWPDPVDIQDTIYPDYVQLTYSIGFNCFMGSCNYHRYWIFKVYYDCSVEFVESYNTSPWTGMTITENSMDNIQIYPNPVKEEFAIQNIEESVNLELLDLSGKIIYSESNYLGDIVNISTLAAGSYLVRVSKDDQSKSMKLIKM
ncbi:T9SS type A sorting domain-containing protein [Paracrocinitomix mangrovi]|uniref:T9SS type A sorting domain-containing protein n=1 Tax=Paracrocinitomix mangrovi TaxID=2862509 RepID=UPI001C8EFAFE|nr:T9SS type A sorting domain-containing protein [Paracrocinitomix mangrovi]UKN02001.1 T9SS type A sorting domain-containing protein [Paracrocinitomix mangrovi]